MSALEWEVAEVTLLEESALNYSANKLHTQWYVSSHHVWDCSNRISLEPACMFRKTPNGLLVGSHVLQPKSSSRDSIIVLGRLNLCRRWRRPWICTCPSNISQANLFLEYSTNKWDFQFVEISIKEQAPGLLDDASATSPCWKILSILFIDIVLGSHVDIPISTIFFPSLSLNPISRVW